MVTKGIVKGIVSKNQVKVRIPILDGLGDLIISIPDDSLYLAEVMVSPNCSYIPREQDIVYITFLERDLSKPVIIGYMDLETDTLVSLTGESLTVTGTTILSEDTTIGKIDYNKLKTLDGIRSNIQEQIDNIQVPQGGSGGEPPYYLKNATVSQDGNTLTITKKDDSQVVFTPQGGGGGTVQDVRVSDGTYDHSALSNHIATIHLANGLKVSSSQSSEGHAVIDVKVDNRTVTCDANSNNALHAIGEQGLVSIDWQGQTPALGLTVGFPYKTIYDNVINSDPNQVGKIKWSLIYINGTVYRQMPLTLCTPTKMLFSVLNAEDNANIFNVELTKVSDTTARYNEVINRPTTGTYDNTYWTALTVQGVTRSIPDGIAHFK